MTTRTLLRNATGFFRELVGRALREQRVAPSVEARLYLVSLLERFIRPEIGMLNRPLALDYLESFHEEDHLRYLKLKRVGDTALFVTGVFMDSFDGKPVGADYYVSLGGSAYGHLASSPLGRSSTPVFAEMSERFADFVRVLSEISLGAIFATDRDTLRIYRRWLATRGARDAGILIRRGLIPMAPRTSTPQ